MMTLWDESKVLPLPKEDRRRDMLVPLPSA
jgi:hypothetical protein